MKTLNTQYEAFNSDNYPQHPIALDLTNMHKAHETPMHTHLKCQLVVPLDGLITCSLIDAIWMVPVNSGIWIPSDEPHSIKIPFDARVCMLFVPPDAIDMPNKIHTISISALVKELIIHLTAQGQFYSENSETAKLANVLLYQVTQMTSKEFDFSIPKDARLNELAHHLLAHPNDRKTISQWATHYSMSERTFTRLVKKNIGTTFGHWRRQLHLILALQMLDEKKPVQLIADELGYESVSAFIVFFKKMLGKPPMQYSKN